MAKTLHDSSVPTFDAEPGLFKNRTANGDNELTGS